MRSQHGENSEREIQTMLTQARRQIATAVTTAGTGGTATACRFRYYVDASFRRAHSGSGMGPALAAVDAAVAAAFGGYG